jgi:hypothetical protein
MEVLCDSITAGISRLWTSMRAVEVGLDDEGLRSTAQTR